MTPELITDFTALQALRAEWQALSERLHENTGYFASWDTTWSYLNFHRPAQWFVLCLRESGTQQLLAVLPLQVFQIEEHSRTFRACQPVGTGYVPYIEFAMDARVRRDVLQVLLNTVLVEQLGMDLVLFWPLHQASPLYLALLEDLGRSDAFKPLRFKGNLYEIETRSRVLVPCNHQYSRKGFRYAAYCQRRLQRQGELLFTLSEPAQGCRPVLEWLCAHNLRKFGQRHIAQQLPHWAEYVTEWLCSASAAGQAQLTTVRLDGQVIAAGVSLVHKGRRTFYLIDYDPAWAWASPAKILIAKLIEQTFREGGVFCFGAGSSNYKLDWGSTVGELKAAVVFLNPQARAALHDKITADFCLHLGGGSMINQTQERSKLASEASSNCSAVSGLDGVCTLQNFGFESGEVISELCLRYSTLGTPRFDAAGQICNAVLVLHSSTGNRQHWLTAPLGAALLGPGQVLDTSRYFIIVPDLIGHGQSSKPSDGLRTSFPRYRCRDMVTALYLLVSQGLHIRQLQLVMGSSLGAMLAWLWGQMYPQSTARLVPIGAYPLPLAGRNWIIRRMSIEAIRHDPAWQGGHYVEPPKAYLYTAPLLILLAHGVQQLQNVAPSRQAADRHYEGLLKMLAQHDANDLLYVLESTLDFDPLPDLEKITAKVLAINFEGDEICRPDISEAEPALKRLPNAQFVLVPAAQDSCGHFSYYQPHRWTHYLAAFLDAPDDGSYELG